MYDCVCVCVCVCVPRLLQLQFCKLVSLACPYTTVTCITPAAIFIVIACISRVQHSFVIACLCQIRGGTQPIFTVNLGNIHVLSCRTLGYNIIAQPCMLILVQECNLNPLSEWEVDPGMDCN